MKQMLLVGMVVVGVAGGLLYLFWHALSTLVSDWRVSREVKEIQAESRDRRRQRKEQDARRLDNGCEHAFDDGHHGEFPPGVCYKCGISQVRPEGQCDHAWQRQEGPTPRSVCQKCGMVFTGSVLGDVS